jgi:hypothetical protein
MVLKMILHLSQRIGHLIQLRNTAEQMIQESYPAIVSDGVGQIKGFEANIKLKPNSTCV